MEISERQLGKAAVCKTCHRVVMPLPARPIGGTGNISGGEIQSFKNCPFCAERILASAKKCRFCNEHLDTIERDGGIAPATANRPQEQDAHQPTGDAKIEFTYRVSTSQWDNFFKYLICLIIAMLAASVYILPTLRPYAGLIFGAVLIVDLVVVCLIYLGTRSSRCFVGPQRVELHSGVFTRQIDWISLASIQDMQLRQGVIQRALQIGTITIKSLDDTTPMLELYQIPKARKIFSYIQEQVARLKRIPR
ncbi:MAG: PH domain-containing protein [Phycisphaerae bacterium]